MLVGSLYPFVGSSFDIFFGDLMIGATRGIFFLFLLYLTSLFYTHRELFTTAKILFYPSFCTHGTIVIDRALCCSKV